MTRSTLLISIPSSSELVATSAVFHEQLQALGVPTEFSYVWLPDEAAGKHQFWATWTEDEDGAPVHRSKAITYDLDKEEPYTAACFAAWASDDPIHVDFISPADIEHFFATWEELLREAEHLRSARFPDGIYYAEGYMQYGCFGIDMRREPTETEREVLRRFADQFNVILARGDQIGLRRAQVAAGQREIGEADVRPVPGHRRLFDGGHGAQVAMPDVVAPLAQGVRDGVAAVAQVQPVRHVVQDVLDGPL